MIFSTFQFLIFFIAVFVLFFTLPKRWRHPLLLAASYYFYMCSIPWYLTVILGITLVDFWAGIKIEDSATMRQRRWWLVLSILSNFGLLFTLKYAPFFSKSVFNDSLGFNTPLLHFVLPLGISFHTFQAVSYTVEVYRGNAPAERNLLTYALYVAFFPQMVAGPIERPYNLLPQFHTEKSLSLPRFTSGLRLAIWGLFKKVAVADLLAAAVNNVYAAPREFNGAILLLATFFFAIQIYCDFSGYSDIAIGIARMMGYDLMINFRQPYFAKSIGEFWRRWHISLSTWFRDYLYIPLGGNRVAKARYLINILVVFVVSGLWHGANWTFVVWGAFHGVYLIVGTLTSSARQQIRTWLGAERFPRLLGAMQILTTFTLVTAAWVFFRAATVQDGFYILSHLGDWQGFHLNDIFMMKLARFDSIFCFVIISGAAIVEYCLAKKPQFVVHLWAERPFRWGLTYACVFAIIFFGVFGQREFIYFQF